MVDILKLNKYLASRCYLNDKPCATADDVARYRQVGIAPDMSEFPHAHRWFTHIEALLEKHPENIDYQQGSMPAAVPELQVATSAELGSRGGGTKLKILAFHGLGQCALTFEEQQSPKDDTLAHKIKNVAELVFVDAPRQDPRRGHQCFRVYHTPAEFDLNDIEAWQTVQEANCVGIEQTLADLEDIWRNDERGPFDGILGFSSGASMAACFVDHMQRQPGPHPRFVICCSGSYTPVPVNLPAYASYGTSGEMIRVPSCHTIGLQDQICFPALSRELASKFFEPKAIEFEGKHRCPQRSSDCRALVDFLNSFLRAAPANAALQSGQR